MCAYSLQEVIAPVQQAATVVSSPLSLDQAMNGWLLWVQETFKNRQVAIGIWSLLAIVVCVLLKDIRKGIWNLLKACMASKLLILFASLGIYITALCHLFHWLGLWTPNQIYSTVLWFLFSGIALSGRTISANEDKKYFRSLIYDSCKAIVVFQFIISEYSFSLPVEIVIVPFMIFLGGLIVVAGSKEEHASTKKILELIVLTVVLALLWNSVTSIWTRPEAFFTTKTGRDFMLPILLTLGSIPFLYLLHCYIHLERASIQIGLKAFQSDELKRYAKRRFYFAFIFRPRLLRRATRHFHNLPAETKGDVNQIIEDIRAYEQHSKSPPKVDERLGWSPYFARDFLKVEGLQTDDYHPSYRGTKGTEWWANSKDVDLDDQIFPNRVAFYIEGQRDLVTRLRLQAYFRGDSDPLLAKARFTEIARTLLTRTNSGNVEDAQEAIGSDEDFALTVNNTHVVWKTESYPNGHGFELYFILSRGGNQCDK